MQIQTVDTNSGKATSLALFQNGFAQAEARLEIAVDVLDLDQRVIHQDADSQQQGRRVSSG